MHWDEVKAAANLLGEKVAGVASAIQNAVVGAIDWIIGKATGFFDWIGGKIEWLGQKIMSVPILGDVIGAGKNAISWVWDKLNTPGAPAPAYATGTSYFRGGISRINEGGRGELVQLPSGTKVFPHTKTKQMMGNRVYNINVNVNGGSNPDETGRIIAKRIKEALDVA